MRKQITENLSIEFLERKYQEQKQIQLKENKRLKHNLQEQMERADLLKIKCEQLQQQNQNLNAAIIQIQQQLEQQGTLQNVKEQQFQLMKQYNQLIKKYNALLAEKGELETLIEKVYNQKVSFEKQLNSFRNNERQLHQQLQLLARKHSQYKHQSSAQIEELLQLNRTLQAQVQRLTNKANDQKRKNRQIQRKVGELQNRLVESEHAEEERFKRQQEQIQRQRNSLYEANLQFNSKYKLLEAKCTQIENRADQLQVQLKESQRKADNEKENAYELKIKLEKHQKMIRQIQQENERLKQQIQKLQSNKNTVGKQDLMRQMNKNLTDINQMSHKHLQRLVQGPTIRQFASQSQSIAFLKQQDSLQRTKLQAKINALEGEILSYKRHIQSFNDEFRKTKRHLDQKQIQLEKRESQIKELRQKLQRESQRGKEILALRKQNQSLRGKETQMIERAKEVAQYETSISLKLAFYQRKIKQHLDSIDRKDSIIEKHKIALTDLEDREKYYEQTLKKLNDQADSLKTYKQECSRKDVLLKDYKAKNEKLRQEKDDLTKDIAKLKADVSKLRSDKQRIQTQLEIKQKQLSSLRTKNEKLSLQKTDQYYKQNSRLKENKNATELKLRKVKKQNEELLQILNQIRLIMLSKVEEYLAKQIPAGKKKAHEYEAAKLLGLKAADLDEFLNPGTTINRRITVQLQQLWDGGNFTQCLQSFINYIVLQEQPRPLSN